MYQGSRSSQQIPVTRVSFNIIQKLVECCCDGDRASDTPLKDLNRSLPLLLPYVVLPQLRGQDQSICISFIIAQLVCSTVSISFTYNPLPIPDEASASAISPQSSFPLALALSIPSIRLSNHLEFL